MEKNGDVRDYTIRFARYSDLGRVNSIMERMDSQIDDTSIFVSDDEDFVRNHIEHEGFIVVAGYNNKVVAFLIVRFPHMNEDNLGLDLGMDEEDLMKVCHMESVIVLDKHRGNALQQKLIAYSEPIAHAMGYPYAMATVSPDNPYSLNNFLDMGYDAVKQKEKYDGVERVILKKEL
ncbi:MAG: N-acetyltransferase family protein [Bacillota bacterium]